jgi:hypothetical protein
MGWASTGTLVGAALMAIWLALVWTSSWLKGRAWFVATIIILAASLVSLEWNSQRTAWDIALLVFVFFGFFYFIGMRYTTQTSVFDMTIHSHDALVRFIDEIGDKSVFALVMRKMGPVLFASLLIFGAVAALAKYTGVLD